MLNLNDGPRPVFGMEALPPSPELSNSSVDVANLLGEGDLRTLPDDGGILQNAGGNHYTAHGMFNYVHRLEEECAQRKEQVRHAKTEVTRANQHTRDMLDGQSPDDYKRICQGAFATMEDELGALQKENDALKARNTKKLDEMQKEIEALKAELKTQKETEKERVETRVKEAIEEALSATTDVYNRILKRPRTI